MSIDVTLKSGSGQGSRLKINGEGEASVVVHPHPPKDESGVAKPFRQYMTDDGTSSGSLDMRVNASLAAPQDFYVKADTAEDIYIKSISILIADAGAALNEFGNLPALTNGVVFNWETADLGSFQIHEGLTTNFEFVRLAVGEPSFGSGTAAFIASNVVSTSEAFIPTIDFQKIFGLPWGLRLRAGTNDRIVFKVRDNVSSIDGFNAIAYGIKF